MRSGRARPAPMNTTGASNVDDDHTRESALA
jgi:hypothetical protein